MSVEKCIQLGQVDMIDFIKYIPVKSIIQGTAGQGGQRVIWRHDEKILDYSWAKLC